MMDNTTAQRVPLGSLLLFALILFPFSLVTANGQRISEKLFERTGQLEERTDMEMERLLIRTEGLHELLATGGNLALKDFPVAPGEERTVEFRLARPAIDKRTKILVGTVNGDVALTTPEVVCYRGVIPGESNSRLFLTSSKGMLFCAITRGDGSSYVLAPATSGEGEYVLMNEMHVKPDEISPNFSCAPIDQITPSSSEQAMPASPGPYRAPTTLLEAAIAVEADYAYFRGTGKDTNKTIAYTAALFSMVSALYEDEINVTLHVPWLKIWTDSIADPYKANGNAYALFDTVPQYWQKHYGNVERHLAHVLTSVDYGGGGIAVMGARADGGIEVLCNKQYGYGMSSPTGLEKFPTFAFTYDVYIVSHELGHNFGAHHTHECWWNPAIDTCYTRDDPKFALSDACHALPITPRPNLGSIMSYCQNVNYDVSGQFKDYKVRMTFLPQVAAAMRREAMAAPCLMEPAEPTVILKSPRGDKSLPIGSDVEITWTSARVEKVKLEYSINNGTNWQNIVSDVAATEGRYVWKTPTTPAQNSLVRIIDMARPDVADTSIIPFRLFAGAWTPVIVGSNTPSLVVTPIDGAIRVECGTGHRAGNLAITLHDLNGREIGRMAMEQEAAAGTRTVTFPAHDLANGVYIVTADADGSRASSRVVIAR